MANYWTNLSAGDIIYVAVPQSNGGYSVQTSEIIQAKDSPYGEGDYWYLRFKITGEDGKRKREQFVMHKQHDSRLCLFEGRIGSLLTDEPRHGKLIAAITEDALRKAANEVIEEKIEESERELMLLEDKIAFLKTLKI